MQSVSKYQLLDRIAKGGMAELFRARVVGAEGFSKVLAIKRILPNLADEKAFVDMLIDEARMVANLSHPNIVQVFELGKDSVGLFIAMEFVNGPNLAAIIKRLAEQGKVMPEACAVDVAIQLLQALDYAHRQTDSSGQPLNMIHRDVSPENVLISSSGAVKLSDFGVAKARGRLHMTQAGNIKGKVPYMSPEQLQGLEIDGRTDIFAAALVLWECLAGQRHYHVDKVDMNLMRDVAEGRIRKLGDVGVKINAELEAVLMKGLQPDVKKRYASAWEFANDLMLYHRKVYPAHTPAVLGKLVMDLFKPQLDALAERLRRFEQGEEQPSGIIDSSPANQARKADGSPAQPQTEVTKPVKAQTVPPPAKPAPSPIGVAGPKQAAAPFKAREGFEDDATANTVMPPLEPPAPQKKAGTKPKLKAIAPTSSSDTVPVNGGKEGGAPKNRGANTDDADIDAALRRANEEEQAEKTKKAREKVSVLAVIVAFVVAAAGVAGLIALTGGEESIPRPTQQQLADRPINRPDGAPAPVEKAHPTPAPSQPTAAASSGSSPLVKPEAGKTGTLDIDCKPDCEIVIDGFKQGLYSPQKGLNVASGRHSIKLSNKQLNLTKTITVEVEADKATSRVVNLVTQ